jgi:hypothetical protein
MNREYVIGSTLNVIEPVYANLAAPDTDDEIDLPSISFFNGLSDELIAFFSVAKGSAGFIYKK